MGRTWSLELARDRITANTVIPTALSPMTRSKLVPESTGGPASSDHNGRDHVLPATTPPAASPWTKARRDRR